VNNGSLNHLYDPRSLKRPVFKLQSAMVRNFKRYNKMFVQIVSIRHVASFSIYFLCDMILLATLLSDLSTS
jgi:hypothetical protein